MPSDVTDELLTRVVAIAEQSVVSDEGHLV